MRVLAVTGVAVVAVLASIALATSPAAAEDSNSGTIDTATSVSNVQQGVAPQGDDCGDSCKRINWCGKGDSPADVLSADAPYVRVDGGKGAPKCILKPVIKYQCCVPSGGSTANIDVTVTVTNPNPVKLKIRVWLDGSAPTEKWVDGDGTAKFNFAGVGNGEHVIHSAVAVGKGAWCQFGDKKITVKCASPSPSPSGSKSPSPSPSVSATVAVPPGNGEPSLPVTGPAVAVYTVVGVGLVAGGWLLYRRFRRNRVTFVA